MSLLAACSVELGAQQAQQTQQQTAGSAPEALLLPAQRARAQFDLGVRLIRDKNFAGAAEAFMRATEEHPDFPEAFNNWGIALVHLGKQSSNPQQQWELYQTAADKFSRAAQLKADQPMTYILWSETLVLLGDLPVDARVRLACYQAAVEKSRKASELAPNDWESYNKWAVILSTKLADFTVDSQAREQLFREAAGLFAKAAKHTRFSGEAGPVYANWASALVQAARATPDPDRKQSLMREALDKFERAARVFPNAASTYAMWGSALIELGKMSRLRADFRDAIDKLNTSLALRPDDPGTLYNLACAYALMDHPVMAVQNLRKCFELDRNKVYRNAAAQDPDLAGLRGDRDFEELISPSGVHGTPRYNPPLRDRPR